MTFSHRLPSLLGASIVGLLLPVVALEHEASACSPPDPVHAYVSVANPYPADGATGVPLNTAIGVELLSERFFEETWTLFVKDHATGQAVPGEIDMVFVGRLLSPETAFPVLLRFSPNESLAPNHRYTVEVKVTPKVERPANALGVEELLTTFTTGPSATPALEFIGKMKVALEPAEEPSYEPGRCDDGQCFCDPPTITGTVSNTTARLSLPRVAGGDASYGYNLRIVVTADRPYNFNPITKEAVALPFGDVIELVGSEPGTASTIRGLGRSDGEYSPCFALQATDFFGNTAVGEPVCLKEKVPPIGLPDAQDAGAPDGMMPAPLESDDDGPRTVSTDDEPSEASSGCSFTASATDMSGSFLVLVALGVGALRRRSARVS
jgi:MYXO-CTERM domain-containing protein